MGISVKHSPSMVALGSAAHSVGRGKRTLEDQDRANAISFKQKQLDMQDEQFNQKLDFQRYQADRDREHAKETMRLNADLQTQMADEAAIRRRENEIQNWEMKSGAEQTRLRKQRVEYERQKDQIEKAIDDGIIARGSKEHQIASVELNKKFPAEVTDAYIPSEQEDQARNYQKEIDSRVFRQDDGTMLIVQPDGKIDQKMPPKDSSGADRQKYIVERAKELMQNLDEDTPGMSAADAHKKAMEEARMFYSDGGMRTLELKPGQGDAKMQTLPYAPDNSNPEFKTLPYQSGKTNVKTVEFPNKDVVPKEKFSGDSVFARFMRGEKVNAQEFSDAVKKKYPKNNKSPERLEREKVKIESSNISEIIDKYKDGEVLSAEELKKLYEYRKGLK